MIIRLSLSREGTRTAWREEPGTGACCGKEFHSAARRSGRESKRPSLIGKHGWRSAWSLKPLSLFCVVWFPPLSCGCDCVWLLNGCMFAWIVSPSLPYPSTIPPSSIAAVRTVCTVPLIDSISGETYTIDPQGGGDEDGFARGAWDWSMLWKRVPLSNREKDMRLTKTEPYR